MTRYEGYTSNSESRMMAFVCGALLGASAALLFAPMRGSDMRQSLADKTRQGRDRLKEYGETGREWAQDRAQRAGRFSRSAFHKATEKLDSAADRAQNALNQGVSRAHEATERARSAVNRETDTTPQSGVEQPGTGPVPPSSTRPQEQWS
jgi:gas vesicle protein